MKYYWKYIINVPVASGENKTQSSFVKLETTKWRKPVKMQITPWSFNEEPGTIVIDIILQINVSSISPFTLYWWYSSGLIEDLRARSA